MFQRSWMHRVGTLGKTVFRPAWRSSQGLKTAQAFRRFSSQPRQCPFYFIPGERVILPFLSSSAVKLSSPPSHSDEAAPEVFPKLTISLFHVPSLKTLRSLVLSVGRTVLVLVRVVHLMLQFAPVLLLYPISRLFPSLRDHWWKLFVFVTERSGPAFLKFGQWASTRRDLFSDEFCNHFSKLHNKTRPHDFGYTEEQIQKAFHASVGDLFTHLEHKPVGSGCVAQVHAGILHDGRKVAVKVLHPRVRNTIQRDLSILMTVARLLEWIPRMEWLSFVDSVAQFSKIMKQQLDLRVEASNLERFSENFRENFAVVFPRPIQPLISQSVLVESYEDGIPMDSFLRQKNADAPQLAKIGFHAFLKMMLLDNFIHADLHPGNILVQTTDATADRTRLVFLDAGLVTTLTPADRRNFLDLFSAIARGKGRKAGELLIERARKQQCEDPETFIAEINALVSTVKSEKLQLDKIRVGDILGKVLKLVFVHKVKIESNFASLVISIMILEGLGRSLDPKLDLLAESIPILDRMEGHDAAIARNVIRMYRWFGWMLRKTRAHEWPDTLLMLAE